MPVQRKPARPKFALPESLYICHPGVTFFRAVRREKKIKWVSTENQNLKHMQNDKTVIRFQNLKSMPDMLNSRTLVKCDTYLGNAADPPDWRLLSKRMYRVTSTHWAIRTQKQIPVLTLGGYMLCLLYTSPSPRDKRQSRMPSSA